MGNTVSGYDDLTDSVLDKMDLVHRGKKILSNQEWALASQLNYLKIKSDDIEQAWLDDEQFENIKHLQYVNAFGWCGDDAYDHTSTFMELVTKVENMNITTYKFLVIYYLVKNNYDIVKADTAIKADKRDYTQMSNNEIKQLFTNLEIPSFHKHMNQPCDF